MEKKSFNYEVFPTYPKLGEVLTHKRLRAKPTSWPTFPFIKLSACLYGDHQANISTCFVTHIRKGMSKLRKFLSFKMWPHDCLFTDSFTTSCKSE